MIDIEEIKNGLANLQSNRPQTKIGIFRDLYPLLSQKYEEGLRAKDLVAWLEDRGVKVSVAQFRVYLNQIDAEHGCVRARAKDAIEPLKQKPMQAARSVEHGVVLDRPVSQAVVETPTANQGGSTDALKDALDKDKREENFAKYDVQTNPLTKKGNRS